ncbi:hypothetical protein LSUE1_G010032 [Lachnellula suecica]|uniref:Uncharacterized protein n=1 Tax=Lachnellula suecica TaxID=602035 RepID=A0A8T9C5X5_9HELO|nr:hypothetical protein LSUE1_G010032 [Lachnellula suecica]
MESVSLRDVENNSLEKLLTHEYVQSDEDIKTETTSKRQRKNYPRIAAYTAFSALALYGLFTLLISLTHFHKPSHHHDPSPVRRSCSCGTSIAEALSMGCTYDSLSPAFLPPHCRDASLTAEFETLGDGPNGTWLYYADRNHTQLLSTWEVMSMAENPGARFHVSWRWHVVHCYMYWIKMYRAQRGGAQVEGRYDGEAHVRHCAGVFGRDGWGTASGVVLDADVEEP